MTIATLGAAFSKNQQSFPNLLQETADQILLVRLVHADQSVLHNHLHLNYIDFELTDLFLNSSSSFANKQPINFLTYLIYVLLSIDFTLSYEFRLVLPSFQRIFIIIIILELSPLLISHFFDLGSNKDCNFIVFVSLLYLFAQIR